MVILFAVLVVAGLVWMVYVFLDPRLVDDDADRGDRP
jgi:hypothetical protein